MALVKKVEFKVIGHPPAKSNMYVAALHKRTKKPIIVKSPVVRAYEKTFCYQIPKQYVKLELQGDLTLQLIVYFRSRRSDLQNAPKVVCDCLEKNKVIVNDNQFTQVYLSKHIDKINPRVEIAIFKEESAE